MSSIILKPHREQSLLRRHPWVFSGAIQNVKGGPGIGETVEVFSADGALLGRGAYSPQSQIRVRMWSFDPEEPVDEEMFRCRLLRAVAARNQSGTVGSDKQACRLVYAESDFLPGLIVDRYGQFVVCQFLSAGAEYWKETLVSLVREIVTCSGIYERSDVDVREKEGLVQRTGLLCGEEPPSLIEITEGECRFLVDIRQGHKTGLYLDQKDNRSLAARYANHAEILNCFSYTGGFTVTALKAGAQRVTNVDSSASALEMAVKNCTLNDLDALGMENIEGDAFIVLRKFRDTRRSFDFIILDPPKFATSRSNLNRACRGYKDINLLAAKLLRPGGTLVTFSCSGLISSELFGKIVADGVLDAGREAQIVRRLFQGSDHPVALSFPEGTYLKGLVCRVW